MSRFPVTYCSQCGGEFGPGDEGFSHCADHPTPREDERSSSAPTVPANDRPTSEVLGLAEDYGQWMWDAGYFDNPEGEKLVDEAAFKREEIKQALEAALHNAYAEGRKDQSEEQPMPQKALELLDEALAFTQSIWRGELNDKDDREGLAFNLRCRLREYLIEVGHMQSKTYSDGTTATGPAPLPDHSPVNN